MEISPELKQLLREKNVIPFVGAGFVPDRLGLESILGRKCGPVDVVAGDAQLNELSFEGFPFGFQHNRIGPTGAYWVVLLIFLCGQLLFR